MTIAKVDRLLVGNLRGAYRGPAAIPPEEALRILRITSGQDFGMDADAWERWLAEHLAEWEQRYDDALGSGALRRNK